MNLSCDFTERNRSRKSPARRQVGPSPLFITMSARRLLHAVLVKSAEGGAGDGCTDADRSAGNARQTPPAATRRSSILPKEEPCTAASFLCLHRHYPLAWLLGRRCLLHRNAWFAGRGLCDRSGASSIVVRVSKPEGAGGRVLGAAADATCANTPTTAAANSTATTNASRPNTTST
jgi:hypothetical protein